MPVPSIPLAAMAKRSRPRGGRAAITLQPVTLPAMQATNLYRAGYAPIIDLWTGAQVAIMEEYERTLREAATADSGALTVDSAASIDAQIERALAAAGALILTIRPRLGTWGRMAEAWHRTRWQRTVQAATGLDLSALIGPEDARETLEAVIARNVGLVRSVSDDARQRIADAVFRGLQNRTPPREVAKGIAESMGIVRRRALRIAAHQNVVLSAQLNEERRRQAGIDAWIWVHSSKAHPREDHKARDGNLYSDNPDRVGGTYEGQRVLAPPPADDLPGIPPNCGCTSRSVLILD